jgi:hypothetical protein
MNSFSVGQCMLNVELGCGNGMRHKRSVLGGFRG